MLESLFNKVEGLQLYEKQTSTQVFSCEHCEILKSSFFYRTTPVAASVKLYHRSKFDSVVNFNFVSLT